MTNQQTCEQRIHEELTTTEQWLTETYAKIDKASEEGNDSLAEELREEIAPYYSAAIKYVMTLELSGGGPSSWLDVELAKARYGFQAVSVIYHFANWFDHAERDVTEQEAPGLWRLAKVHADSAGWWLISTNN